MIQSLLIIIGFFLTLYTVYTTLISKIPLNVFPFITVLIAFICIIYYVTFGYKKGTKSYKLAIILDMITLIFSIIPMIVFINFVGGLIQLAQLIVIIYFLKNMDNTKIASKSIVVFTILSLIVTIIICVDGYGIRSIDGFPSMILSGTFALVYYIHNRLSPFDNNGK